MKKGFGEFIAKRADHNPISTGLAISLMVIVIEVTFGLMLATFLA